MGLQKTIEKNMIPYIGSLKDHNIDPEKVKSCLTFFDRQRELLTLVETYVLKRYGIPLRQLETLSFLYHIQGEFIMPAQLAEGVHLTRGAMTSNLDSIERKGYITRSPHPSDRRKIVITLTKKGLEFCEKTLPMRYDDLAKIMDKLSWDMLETLQQAYTLIEKAIQEIVNEDPD